MIPELPLILSEVFAILSVCMAALVTIGVNIAARRLGMEPARRRRLTITTGGLLAGWLVCTAVLAFNGVYRDFSAMPPRMVLFAVAPVIVVMIVLLIHPATKRLLSALPTEWLIYAQTFRIVVEVEFYFLLINHAMPELMTFEGRNMDIFVGLTAPFVAYFFAQEKLPAKALFVWNIAGIIILCNVIVHGMLSVPTPLQVFITDPPNTFMTYFPFIWLAAFLAPLGLALHGLSLKQIVSRS